MSESNQEGFETSAQPTLCSDGCGFFANMSCGGLCSKCHRDKMSEEDKTRAASAAVEAAQASVSGLRPKIGSPVEEVPVASSSVSVSPVKDQPPQGLATPSRCTQCRKKVGLTGFKCKCGELFCGQHRYAEAHNCDFDYKTTERQKLAEANPLCQAQKIQKI
jgi:hypothetical protein